ncbi:MAG: hypothetical protein N2749_00880 [Clostridia bacterium]|nr:hypothetical protein [Clostridia bacterium]
MIIGAKETTKTSVKIMKLAGGIVKKIGIVGLTGVAVGVLTYKSKETIREIQQETKQITNLIKNELNKKEELEE